MLDPTSFNTSFKILQSNAEKLRTQKELDIDALVPLVEESMQAYTICKARIDAVKAALAQHIGQEAG